MGLLDVMGVRPGRRDVAAGPPRLNVASPWADRSNLETAVWAGLFGVDDLGILTRGLAMSVPASARARHLIAASTARCPLVVMREDVPVDPAPTWTSHTPFDEVSPFHRMLWTVDDLYHYGWSLWTAYRGARDVLLDAGRIPWDRWEFDDDGIVYLLDLDGSRERADSDKVILIPGPHEGVLSFGAKALRQALGLAEAALRRAETPSAFIDLHYTGDKPLNDEVVDVIRQSWVDARKGRNGGVAVTNKYVEARELGAAAEQLLIEGRNAAAVEIARLAGIPAAMVDATTATASLTYETTTGRNAEFIDYGLGMYMAAVEGRLSLDDVVPHGQSTHFDTSPLRALNLAPTGPAVDD